MSELASALLTQMLAKEEKLAPRPADGKTLAKERCAKCHDLG